MVKKILPFLIIISIGAFITLPLFHGGFYPTHDGEYHIIRFHEFYKVLQDGAFYPRWAPDLNNGYGVPLFNFVYPLPNYIASLFHLFGFSFIDSFKASMIIGMVLSGVLFFLWMKEFVSKESSLVASIFYMSAPYHILDIIIRGSIGEVWALAFFPGFLWSVTRYKEKRDLLHFYLSILLLSLTIFSHNILALMFFSFAIVYSVWMGYLSTKRETAELLLIFLWSLAITAIFWLPALLEEQYVTGLELYNVRTNFAEIYQLIIPGWGSGFFNSSSNPMSVQIGLANLLVVFIAIGLFVFRKKKRPQLIFFLSTFLFLVFLMLPFSEWVWKVVPLLNFFQFPWRILSLVILVTSFLSGLVADSIRFKWVALIFAIIPILLAIGYNTPAYYFDRNDEYYILRDNFIHGTNSPGNYFNTIWMKAREKPKELVTSSDALTIISKTVKSQSYSFDIGVTKDAPMVLNTAYFPGWSAHIDNKKTNVDKTPSGLLSLDVAAGKHKVDISFSDTPVRQLSVILSLFSLAGLVIMSLRKAVLQ